MKRQARAAARRGLLLAELSAGTVRGAARAAWQAPGSQILLIHNTLGADADRLIAHVREHRDHYVDVDDAVPTEDRTPPASLALTFDDGFKSNLEVGRRLAAEGLRACFYVPTSVIGSDRSASDEFFGRRQLEGVMTWSDLEELVTLGHEVGSHCRRHVPLTTLSHDEAEDQVRGSLGVLRDRLGSARHFAWPFGARRYAPVREVVRWCEEEGAVAASGVRGLNNAPRWTSEGYLRRDAVDLRWLAQDVSIFRMRATSVRRERRPAADAPR